MSSCTGELSILNVLKAVVGGLFILVLFVFMAEEPGMAVFVLFMAFLLVGGYMTAREKAKKRAGPMYPHLVRASENWKQAPARLRMLALTTGGLEPEEADRMATLPWSQLSADAQFALVKFQTIGDFGGFNEES